MSHRTRPTERQVAALNCQKPGGCNYHEHQGQRGSQEGLAWKLWGWLTEGWCPCRRERWRCPERHCGRHNNVLPKCPSQSPGSVKTVYRTRGFGGFCFFAFFRAAPVAYGGSQARGLIRVAAASPHYSHSDPRSKPHLQPTPQLETSPDP